MSGCIFCDIVAGHLPSSTVYADDTLLAMMDINPVNTGHVLVLPKRHVESMADLDEATGAHLFKATMRVARAIRESGVKCEGINLFLADGEAAFQEIFHLHMHVFRRFKGDSFKIDADWSRKPARRELDDVARRIRSSLGPQPLDGS